MKGKKLQGSVLVFSLLVLALLLSAALSGAAAVVSGKRSALATEKSILAFQVAEGAAENVLWRIYNFNNTNPITDATLDSFASALFGQGTDGTEQPGCSGGVIAGRLPSSSGTYEVTFYDNASPPNKLGCSSSTWRTDLNYIKATGSYNNATIRAISATIRPLP